MQAKNIKIGLRVVRSKGDYVVGRTGTIVDIDNDKQRARVQWDKESKTWVKFEAIEDMFIPYKIIPYAYNVKTGRHSYPKYVRL